MAQGTLLLVLVGLTILIADAGLFTIGDAAIFAILVSVVFRHLAVYMLILVGTLQDTPGLAGAWWYVGFVGVGCVVIVHSHMAGRNAPRKTWSAELTLLLFALGVVAYGTLISFFSDSWLDLEQSFDRPFYIVGGLIAFNIVCAYYSVPLLYKGKQWVSFLRAPLTLILLHMMVAALIQALIDPSFLASAVASIDFESTGQLATVTSLGFTRITGTYATPNGFALVSVLLLLFWLPSYRHHRVPLYFVLIFIVIALLISTLSLSKAMLAFSALCSAVMLLFVGLRSSISRSIVAVLVGVSLILLSDIIFNPVVLDSFRIDALDWDADTYRNMAWRAVIDGFIPSNWFLGTGLSHWPVFFEKTVGFKLSDPHTWIFSYVGTFGILGFVFFAFVLWRLVSSYFLHAAGGRALMICLLVLLLIKDAVSIPYLLGNTPLTWFIWVLIFSVCSVHSGAQHSRSSSSMYHS